MLLEATTKADTPVKSIAGTVGYTIETIPANTTIKLNGINTLESGTSWYKEQQTGGWIESGNITINRDIEYLYTSNIRTFAMASTSSIAPTASQADPKFTDITSQQTAQQKALSKLKSNPSAAFGNLFLNAGKMFPNVLSKSLGSKSSSLKGMINAGIGINNITGATSKSNTMASATLNSFVSTGDSMFGKALGSTKISDLMSGNFFDSLVDNLLTGLVGKLSYVVGFNTESIWSLFLDPFGLDGDAFGAANGYGGLLNEYTDINYIDGYFNPYDSISKYFKYLGCDGTMILKQFDGLTWLTDSYYTTPSLTPSQIDEDVQFHKSLYDADYNELQDAISTVKSNLNLTIERMDWFKKFNRYQVTHPDYHLTNSTAHIFFTRPDLNILENGSVTEDVKNSALAPLFTNLASRHVNIMGSLTKAYSGTHDFIPIFTTAGRNFDLSDESIKTIEHGETLTGWKIVYGRNNNESKSAGTFSIKFIDDNELSIYILHKIWTEYISGVSRGIIKPKDKYIRDRILDYACSAYYFLTGPDGETILFWSKMIGVFPTVAPSSAFSHSAGEVVTVPSFDIQYSYSFKDDFNPLSLAEFNHNSDNNFSYVDTYNPETTRCSPSMVGAPFVETTDGGNTFKLRYREAEE